MPVSAVILRRRIFVLLINAATLALALAAMFGLLAAHGVTLSEGLVALGFALTLPYTVLGFWNALIGLVLRHLRPGVVRAMPGVAEIMSEQAPPIPGCDTVVVMTLRNEAPGPVFERLARMRRSLVAAGACPRFTFAVLSDSDDPEIIALERAAFDAFAVNAAPTEPAPIYRRRIHNTGYKAGNISEFLDAHGAAFDYFIPLDADSLMSADVMMRMVDAMQRRPSIGILQSLVVGMPTDSGFARVFQFGMRHAMRAFTTGAAWWTADCGSYWGHNAVIRLAPFRDHCRLPRLSGGPPLGGAVLSHDQLEAAFMRRAGYEVRVVPVETDSYEINPPTLVDFIRRELRWCQGNMQYFKLLRTPGLRLVSRFQLVQAIGMYLAPAAWIGMVVVSCVGGLLGDLSLGSVTLGFALFIGVFVLAIAPKIMGVVDVLLSPRDTVRYGGVRLFTMSAIVELVSSILIAPVVAVSVTLFLIGLAFGRSMAWGGQNRDCPDLAWRDALGALAPHTLVGLGIAAMLWSTAGAGALLWGAPMIVGPALAIPLTIWSARRGTGAAMRRLRLCLIPEERETPGVLALRDMDGR